MLLTTQENRRVLNATRSIPLNAPAERVDAFISRTLGFNVIQQAVHFPDPDPGGLLAIAVGNLTQAREAMLRDECDIPNFVVFDDSAGGPLSAGFSTYLASRGFDARFQGRLNWHRQIRTTLRQSLWRPNR